LKQFSNIKSDVNPSLLECLQMITHLHVLYDWQNHASAGVDWLCSANEKLMKN